MDFYVELLRFKISVGNEEGTAAYLSAGGHHYLLALDTWFAQHLPQSEAPGTGIFHSLIQYPTRKDLATVYLNLKTAPTRLLMRSTLEFQKSFIWKTQTETAWSCVGIAPKKNGPRSPMVTLKGHRDL